MVIFNGPVRLRVAFKRVTVAAVTTVTVEVATVAAEAGTVAAEVAAVVAWPRPDAPCARLSSTARMRSAFTGTQRHRRFTGEGTDARRGGGTLAGRSGPRCCVSSRLSRTSVPLAASASHPGGASRTGGLSSPPCTPWVHVGPPGCRTAHHGVALSPLLGGAPPPGAHGLRGGASPAPRHLQLRPVVPGLGLASAPQSGLLVLLLQPRPHPRSLPSPGAPRGRGLGHVLPASAQTGGTWPHRLRGQ